MSLQLPWLLSLGLRAENNEDGNDSNGPSDFQFVEDSTPKEGFSDTAGSQPWRSGEPNGIDREDGCTVQALLGCL